MNPTDRGILALISDTHGYQAGLPRLFQFFRRHQVSTLACLGDCDPEPFRLWLEMSPQHQLLWIYDVYGADQPLAANRGLSLEVEERVLLAHTRATAFIHFKSRITAYREAEAVGRPPLIICHGHTHTPCVTQYGRTLNQIIYIHSAPGPHLFQPRKESMFLECDAVYLVVPGAFTMAEECHPTFSFAFLDLRNHYLEMFSLTDLEALDSLGTSIGKAPIEQAGR
jgi:predicted phosphodiesterase